MKNIKHILICIVFICCTFVNITAQQRITGGNNITISEAPWQVLMLINGSPNCGGAIISSEYILTAKHCVQGTPVNNIQIIAGSTSSSNYSSQDVYNVSKIITHPDMDAAILKLSRPLAFSAYIEPVNVISSSNDNYYEIGREGIVTGWGWMYANGREMSETLQEAEVMIISNDEASKARWNGMA